MRLILYLFSLYILVLSGVPCRADDDCCAEEVAANTAHPQPKKEHPTCPGPCSPFFACGACHGFVIPEVYTAVPEKESEQTLTQAIYKDESLPDFPNAIWQPPRMV